MCYLMPMKGIPIIDVNSSKNDSLDTLVHDRLDTGSSRYKKMHPPQYNVADTKEGRGYRPSDKALPTL
jgi:hypothetical protein